MPNVYANVTKKISLFSCCTNLNYEDITSNLYFVTLGNKNNWISSIAGYLIAQIVILTTSN